MRAGLTQAQSASEGRPRRWRVLAQAQSTGREGGPALALFLTQARSASEGRPGAGTLDTSPKRQRGKTRRWRVLTQAQSAAREDPPRWHFGLVSEFPAPSIAVPSPSRSAFSFHATVPRLSEQGDGPSLPEGTVSLFAHGSIGPSGGVCALTKCKRVLVFVKLRALSAKEPPRRKYLPAVTFGAFLLRANVPKRSWHARCCLPSHLTNGPGRTACHRTTSVPGGTAPSSLWKKEGRLEAVCPNRGSTMPCPAQ